MKKEYNTPEVLTIKITLSADILGDSKLESDVNTGYNNPTENGGGGDPLDPFG